MTPAAVTSISRADIPIAELREISPFELFPSEKNPRRNLTRGDVAELEASIREHGIQSPLLVRPFAADLDHSGYEIVAGHRRLAAAVALDLKAVPCIVRSLSDDEAAEIALIDNLQRVDIPPMDEAEAFCELLDRLLSIPAVAVKVGKEIAYVAKALKLRSLSEPARLALKEKLITIDHARLLCRLAELEQNEALKWCLNPHAGVKTSVDEVIAERLESRNPDPEEEENDGVEDTEASRPSRWQRQWEPETVQRLKEHIEGESGTPLDRAPWRMAEASLIPDVPACAECEKNTKANAPLFGDLDTGVAVCTDGGCFKAKTATFVQIELKKASTEKLPALWLSWKSTSTAPRMEKDGSGPKLTQVFKYGQWMDVGPKGTKCEHTRPGVTVDWDEPAYNNGRKLHKPGELIQVCIQPKCKTHSKAYEKQQRSERRDPAAEKAAAEKKKQAAIAESKLRMAMATAALEEIKTIPGDALRQIVLAAAPNWGDRQKVAEALIPGFRKTLQSAKVESAEFAKIVALVSLEETSVSEYHGPQDGRADFLKSVRRLGYKGPDPWSKPEPKATPEKAKPAKETAAAKKPAKKAATKKPAKKAGRK